MFGSSTINAIGLRNFKSANSGRRLKIVGANCSVLNMRQCHARRAKKNGAQKSLPLNLKMEVKTACLTLVAIIVFSGTYYLFQVNSLASKGYELKELQNKVATLEEANKKGRIKEVELMSMYNIEKVTENLDLVNLNDVTYLELNGPVAMK